MNGRPDLEHLPAKARHEPFLTRALGDFLEIGQSGLLVAGLPVVEGDRQPLVLDGPVDAGREGTDALAPLRRLGLELQAVRTDIRDPLDSDELSCVLSRPAADARDERVDPGEPRDFGPRVVGDACVSRPRSDRREGPVDVEQDRGALGRLGQRGDGIEAHAS